MFLLIGLQVRWILRDVQDSGVPLSEVVTLCLSTFVAVIVLRLVWVFPARFAAGPARPGQGDRASTRRGSTPPCSAGPGCAAW